MSRRIRKLLSVISVSLCALITFTLPAQVFAATLPEDKTIYSSFDNVQGESETIGNIVTELSDSRTENTKEFMLDDGTTMIAEYNQPVHYKNDKGKWVEYNNNLIADTSTSTADEVSNGDYSNKSSNIDIKLSKKAKSNNMIKVASDDFSISLGYDNVNKSKISIVKNDDKLIGNEKFTILKNITSEAKYENVYKNVDLQYFVTSTGVKENIILKDSDVQNEFNITYKIKNLTAKQTNDYTITLYNKENKAVYTIVAPYMTDAKGESSNQLKFELVSQKGGNLKVKLTADYSFIHSIGRSFPITVDPEITNKLTTAISFSENTNNSIKSYGPYYNSNNSYLICKVKSLPQLEDGEKIISAKYNFETTNGSTLFANENENPVIINAHKLKSISNGVSEYDSDVLDYDSLTYNDSQFLSFDLTKTVKEWYDNGDNIDGFVLESFDTVGSKTITFKDSTPSSTTPSLTLIYKDFTGTENNLTYHTIPVGHNAQASVSDYLGNLVINQTLYEGTGSRMPVTLTATYNSINYNKIFENGSPSGYGWQFSFNQYVREVTDTNLTKAGYNYIYTDSDGTDHYLKKSDDNEEWYDEDSLGITLTKTDTNILIDNDSTIQTYELTSDGGKLLSEKDEHNNTITYTYANGNVTKITDGSGRDINILYLNNSEGYKRVKSIITPDNRTIDFSYTSTLKDKISDITFTDGKQTKFEYNNSDRLTSVIQSDIHSTPTQQSKNTFVYSNDKVTKITEYGSDNTEGNYLSINYGNDNTTEISDRYARKLTYTFDNAGNQVSVLNANGYLESSDSSGLSISSGADSFTKNYITESTEQSAVGSGKYYYKTNGGRNGTTSSGGTVTIDNSEPTETNGQVQYFGTTSIKVYNPKSSTKSAFFTGATHQIDSTMFNGQDITFSAYVKTKDANLLYSGGPIGATLKIKCYDSSGATLKDVNSIGISGTQDWQRLSISVEVPSNTSRIRLYCNLRYTSGTAWFDCLQLEKGECANDFNALQNGNFESNDCWLTNENNAISVQNGTVTIDGKSGAYEDLAEETTTPVDNTDKPKEQLPTTSYIANYKVPNSYLFTYDDYGNVISEYHGTVDKTIRKVYLADSDSTETTTPTNESTSNLPSENIAPNNVLDSNYIYQNVKVGRAGVMFNLSGEAQAKSVPLSNENRTFGVALNIYYKNCSVPETHYKEFNAATNRRQSICMAVSPNDLEKEINYVAFAFVYGYNENEMTIYNAMMNISTIPLESPEETTTGTDNSNTSDSGIEYDGYIYCEALQESKNTDYEYTENAKTYDSTGNYVTSESNGAGYTVNYTYDINGNITSTKDAKGNVTNFTYDSSNNITKVKSGNVENQYHYNGAGLISAIDHNSFSYSFNYDVLGNLISTEVGNVAISSNTYNVRGLLEKTTYANGDYLNYLYDSYDNLLRITGENGTLSMFVYNKKGLVAKAIDVQNDRILYYYYDLNGNVEKKYCQTDDGDSLYYVTTNSNGEIIEKTSINGYDRTIVRGTLNGESYIESNGITVSKSTDDFSRKKQVKTSRSGYSNVFYTNYEYASGSETNSTTNLVSKITQKRGDFNLACFEYNYDRNGNITQIKRDGNIVASYTYDKYNQMSTSYDRSTLKYTEYSYDNAGNITSTKEHDVVNGTPSGAYVEKTYAYGDTNWKDKLTSYNGTEISYDAMGNPLSYRDSMSFTWENGRILKSVKTSDNEVTMKYDSNGMRIQKDDKNRTINYYYDCNYNLTGLSYGGNTVYFYYNDDGEATAMSFDNTMYYYIKDLQGNVVKIVNQSGTTVVTYTYDSLGKIVDQTDTTTYSIADINPFRYRGYVYDKETGLYYLQSRYYDPETGRFINADIYCDTMTNMFGTNMFTYCNNNPVNQVDPEGTDAMWVQFSDAVQILDSMVINFDIKLGFTDVGVSITTEPVQLGHTSLLVEDAFGVWWYFYWGDKHMFMRPCGTSNFTSTSILNSYLSGFDPRWYHNYYVYAINVFDDSLDTGYNSSNKDPSKYNHKIHDGLVTGAMFFTGDFVDSYKYCLEQIKEAAAKEGKHNISEYTFSFHEGNKTIGVIHLFNKGYNGEYTDLKHYNLAYRNCVQQTIRALKQSKEVKSDPILSSALNYGNSFLIPNVIFAQLVTYSRTQRMVKYRLKDAISIINNLGKVYF